MGGPEFKAFFEQFYPQQKEIAAASPIGKLYQDFRSGLIPQSVFNTAVRLETKEKEEGLTLQQQIGEEARLRNEYNKRAQSLSDAETSFSNLEIAANQNTGPGDIALITSFMKMLDPGSVVREGEFQTAEQSSGLFNKLTNLLEKAQTGSRLAPKQRNDFVDLARKYLEASRKKEAQVRASYRLIVDNYKLNPVNVFGTAAVPSVTAPAPTTPPAVPPGVAAAPATSTPPQSFLDDQKIRQIANSRGLTIEQIWQQLPDEMRKRYAGN
jgi:hypothetical protein